MQNRKWQMADVQEYGLLKANAKENRNHLTEAESIFWEIAKGSGLGEKCRRQYIIGTYIVDFFFQDQFALLGYTFYSGEETAVCRLGVHGGGEGYFALYETPPSLAAVEVLHIG